MKYSLLSLVFFSALTAQAAETVQVCVPAYKEELMTAAVLVARDKGYFEAEGVNVAVKHWTERGSEAQQKEMLARSNVRDASKMPQGMWTDTGVGLRTSVGTECQVGATSIDSAVMTGIELAKLQPLYFYLYGVNYDTHLVVAKNSAIRKVADLKGKKVRVDQVPTQIAIRKILAEAGLKETDVELVYSSPFAIRDQLAKNEIAAAIAYNPTMALLMASGEVRPLKLNVMGKYVKPFVPHAVIAANRDFAQKHPVETAAIGRALTRASEFIAKNPQELVRVYQENGKGLGMEGIWRASDAEVARAGALMGEIRLHRLGDNISYDGRKATVYGSLQAYQAEMSRLGFIKKPLDFSPWKRFIATATASR